MKLKTIRWMLAAVLAAGMIGLGGCVDDSSSSSKGTEVEQAFDFTLTSYKTQNLSSQSRTTSGTSSLQASEPSIMRGQLTATNTGTSAVTTFSWSVYLDENAWTLASNNTAILPSGNYEFSLLLSEGDQQYVGSAVLALVDGTADIPMTIRPVIGETLTSVTIAGELADFKFSYDPGELSIANIGNPQIGIEVDGESEQLFAINPTTGIADAYINLNAGQHNIHLNLYDDSIQKGRSVVAQETVIVIAGSDIEMDLIPLHSEIELVLTENGGDALFKFSIPQEVVQEAGAIENLQVLLSVTGNNNPIEETILNLQMAEQGNYTAEVTLNNKQYDDVTLSLTFTDIASSPTELLGSCNQSTILDATNRAISCPLILRRRAVIGGSLLSVVGFNVFDEEGAPIPGATITEGGNILGVTGSGVFGTPGYLKTYLNAGDYDLHAEANSMSTSINLNVLPFTILNIELILDTPSGACNDEDAIGTECGGGIKFSQGLVAAAGDQEGPGDSWGVNQFQMSPASSESDEQWIILGTSFDNGKENTEKMIENGHVKYEAAITCNAKNTGGTKDWYLPARDELHMLIRNSNICNNYQGNCEGNACPQYDSGCENGTPENPIVDGFNVASGNYRTRGYASSSEDGFQNQWAYMDSQVDTVDNDNRLNTWGRFYTVRTRCIRQY
ncbi:MAG: carboxypeptidase-like regulatory domain-containing protein [Bermanella sp.]